MAVTTYTTARRCLTGINEYRFFRETEEIGSAAALVLPEYPVTLDSRELRLRCSHDRGMTLFPGCSRPVHTEPGGEEYARIFWDGTGKHRMQTPFGTISVLYQDEMYLFIRSNICIGALRRSRQELPGAEWEPRMSMMTETRLPEALAVLLLSFPLLQIGP